MNICELILHENFKGDIPQQITVYLNFNGEDNVLFYFVIYLVKITYIVIMPTKIN